MLWICAIVRPSLLSVVEGPVALALRFITKGYQFKFVLFCFSSQSVKKRLTFFIVLFLRFRKLLFFLFGKQFRIQRFWLKLNFWTNRLISASHSSYCIASKLLFYFKNKQKYCFSVKRKKIIILCYIWQQSWCKH